MEVNSKMKDYTTASKKKASPILLLPHTLLRKTLFPNEETEPLLPKQDASLKTPTSAEPRRIIIFDPLGVSATILITSPEENSQINDLKKTSYDTRRGTRHIKSWTGGQIKQSPTPVSKSLSMKKRFPHKETTSKIGSPMPSRSNPESDPTENSTEETTTKTNQPTLGRTDPEPDPNPPPKGKFPRYK
ncbi:hypothetical protein O181_018217 [Austropuccinia psidii MF-1]|uniref:Uncharacterized protein n=1 Tax=Austropuccinia psidii MF-1 TaxID=1389203 RepID=A0A9Q3C952_9BASI|nr:hypothetical protein [Austropuccinia psidii MF-1]